MKKILRHFVINTVALYLASNAVSGMVFKNGAETLLLTGAGLTIASLIAKPVINLLMLPINLITFGFFRWVAAAITLYLVTLVVPGFTINNFSYAGYSSVWFDIPALYFAGIVALIAFSFLHSLIVSFIHWLIH